MALIQKKIINSVASALLILSFWSCKNDLAEVARLAGKEDTGIEQMKEVEIIYSDSAIVRVKIIAPVLIRHTTERSPYEEFPSGVRVSFFNPLGQIESVLTANYAIRYANEGRIIARDSVVWKSESEEQLETEELIWEESAGKIYSDKFVTIKRPGEVIYGVGFETDQEFTQWTINAPEGEFQLEESNTDNSTSTRR